MAKNIFKVDGPRAVEVYDNFMQVKKYTPHTRRTKRTAFTQFVRWATGDDIPRRKRGSVTGKVKGRKAIIARPSVGDDTFNARVKRIMHDANVSKTEAKKLVKIAA